MTCRKNWAHMSVTEKQQFIAAVLHLKNLTPSTLHPTDPSLHRYDDYVELHLSAMSVLPSWGHNAPAFFSWHRELLRHLEMDLQATDATVSVPYWDWLTNPGTGLPIWDPDPLSGLGTNGVGASRKVMDGAFAFDSGNWTVRVKDNPAVDPDFLTRTLTASGVETLTTIAPNAGTGDVGDQARALAHAAYDSVPWWDLNASGNFVRPNAAMNVLRVASEYDLHNLVHRWVAGNMGQMASPNDPIFFLHHCNLDRLWSEWQRQHPTSAPYLPTPPTAGVPAGHRSDQALFFTDATHPTAPWPGSATSASLVNHQTLVPGGYWYDTDPPEVVSRTSSIDFHDVPQGMGGIGVTTYRAIVLEAVPGPCNAIRFEIIAGPTPGFATPLGLFADIGVSDSGVPVKGRLWLSYTSTSGTIVGGSVTVKATSRDAIGGTIWTDSWTVNLAANSVPRPKSAVTLVLDRSGSMSDDAGDGIEKIAKVREAVGVFTDVMQQGDGLAIVRFDHESDLLFPVTDVGPQPAVAGSGRALAAGILASHNAADTIDPRGATSIGAGVADGKLALDSAPVVVPPYTVKAMLVLTDGNENFAPMIADVESTGITANTFAIGFGTPQNVSATALNRLTQNHNGYLLITGAIGASEQFLLSKYFLQILAGVNNQDIVVDPQGQLIFGAQHRVPFTLTEADYGADIVLLAPAPHYIDFALETPDGNLITPATVAVEPAVSHLTSTNVAYYRIGLPALASAPAGSHVGRWHAILSLGKGAKNARADLVAQQRGRALPYSLLVHAYSSLRFHTSLQQRSLELGAEVTINANLTEYDIPIEGRARVWAEVTRPDRTGFVLPLKEMEGGHFSGAFLATLGGVYSVRVQATGATHYGTSFRRERTLTAVTFVGADRVRDPGARDLIDQLDERDERFCHLLTCLLSGKTLGREFAKKLAAIGVDLEAIRECVKTYCDKPRRIPHEGPLDAAKHRRQLAALRDVRALLEARTFATLAKPEPIEPIRRTPMPKGMPIFPSRADLEKMREGHGHQRGETGGEMAKRKKSTGKKTSRRKRKRGG